MSQEFYPMTHHNFHFIKFYFRGFPAGSVVENLTAMQETLETQIWSLGWEDSLEKEMATHSCILAWEIPWTEEPGGLQSMELHTVRHDWVTNTFTFTGSLHGSVTPCDSNLRSWKQQLCIPGLPQSPSLQLSEAKRTTGNCTRTGTPKPSHLPALLR